MTTIMWPGEEITYPPDGQFATTWNTAVIRDNLNDAYFTERNRWTNQNSGVYIGVNHIRDGVRFFYTPETTKWVTFRAVCFDPQDAIMQVYLPYHNTGDSYTFGLLDTHVEGYTSNGFIAISSSTLYLQAGVTVYIEAYNGYSPPADVYFTAEDTIVPVNDTKASATNVYTGLNREYLSYRVLEDFLTDSTDNPSGMPANLRTAWFKYTAAQNGQVTYRLDPDPNSGYVRFNVLNETSPGQYTYIAADRNLNNPFTETVTAGTERYIVVGSTSDTINKRGVYYQLGVDGPPSQVIGYDEIEKKPRAGGSGENDTGGGGGSDTTAPTAPGQPSLSNEAATSVTLTWTASTDEVGVTGYDIYKDGTLYTSLGNVLTGNVTGLTTGTTYSFIIKAKDAADNVSLGSPARNYTPTSGGGSGTGGDGVPPQNPEYVRGLGRLPLNDYSLGKHMDETSRSNLGRRYPGGLAD